MNIQLRENTRTCNQSPFLKNGASLMLRISCVQKIVEFDKVEVFQVGESLRCVKLGCC